MNSNLLNKVIYGTKIKGSTFHFQKTDNSSFLNVASESHIKPARLLYTGIWNIPEEQTFSIQKIVSPEIKIEFKPGTYSLISIWYFIIFIVKEILRYLFQ